MQEANAKSETNQFWITARNNFLDIAILEWCKLFADKKSMHHWRKSIADSTEFNLGLMDKLKITESMFHAVTIESKTYRDKFVAHLDEDETMNIPNLTPAIRSTQYLYEWLVEREDDCDAFIEAPKSAIDFYRQRLDHGRSTYPPKTAA